MLLSCRRSLGSAPEPAPRVGDSAEKGYSADELRPRSSSIAGEERSGEVRFGSERTNVRLARLRCAASCRSLCLCWCCGSVLSQCSQRAKRRSALVVRIAFASTPLSLLDASALRFPCLLSWLLSCCFCVCVLIVWVAFAALAAAPALEPNRQGEPDPSQSRHNTNSHKPRQAAQHVQRSDHTRPPLSVAPLVPALLCSAAAALLCSALLCPP